ncbi:branched-chain amino acid ABC transporter permease [Azospirillum sp.]|uniref:branched-chain amino acid ABC transporter permease n=1 Tax=Azospirillum sp. TaxID=34012 RepID=UPI003D74F9AE
MTARTLAWLFVLFMATLPLWMNDQYILYVLTSTGIFIIAAMSLNLLLGYTGQLSLGHVAFFGIGAYTSALLSLGFDLDLGGAEPFVLEPQPVWLAFLGGILMAALFGWLIGRLAFRVRGAYFVIVSVSFAQVMRMVALNWVDLTEGPMALNNIPPLTVWWPGEGVLPLYKKEYYYLLVLAVAVVSFLLIHRLVRSRVGRALVALRENESLARSVGINITRYLVVATVLSAGMAGAAGALYTHYIRIVDPDVFMFIYTVTMVIMVVTGGKGTLAGPIVGGLLFGFLPEVLRDVARPEMQWIIYGVVMIAIVFFLPQGIVPAVSKLFASKRSSRDGRTPAAPRVSEGASS